MAKWIMKTGEQIEMSEMKDSHLDNTIRALQEKRIIKNKHLLPFLIKEKEKRDQVEKNKISLKNKLKKL